MTRIFGFISAGSSGQEKAPANRPGLQNVSRRGDGGWGSRLTSVRWAGLLPRAIGTRAATERPLSAAGTRVDGIALLG
jgi:hypothetical protein